MLRQTLSFRRMAAMGTQPGSTPTVRRDDRHVRTSPDRCRMLQRGTLRHSSPERAGARHQATSLISSVDRFPSRHDQTERPRRASGQQDDSLAPWDRDGVGRGDGTRPRHSCSRGNSTENGSNRSGVTESRPAQTEGIDAGQMRDIYQDQHNIMARCAGREVQDVCADSNLASGRVAKPIPAAEHGGARR